MIWSFLASLIGGPIVNGLINVYKAKLDAANTRDRIAADLAAKDIEAQIEARKNGTEIRKATAGFWEMRLMTFLIAFPFVVHLWLVFLDTIIDAVDWRVPKFPYPFDEWEGAILLSFFGIYIVGKALQGFSAAIAMRKRDH